MFSQTAGEGGESYDGQSFRTKQHTSTSIGAIKLFRELALKIHMFLHGGLKLSNYQQLMAYNCLLM